MFAICSKGSHILWIFPSRQYFSEALRWVNFILYNVKREKIETSKYAIVFGKK